MLEIIFYVVFIVTFSIGTWLLLYRTPAQTRRQHSTIILLVANTVMFLLATTVCGQYTGSSVPLPFMHIETFAALCA